MRQLIYGSAVALMSLVGSAGAANHSGASTPTPGPITPVMMLEDNSAEPTIEVHTLSDDATHRGGRFNGREVTLKRDVSLLVSEDGAAEAKHTAKLPVGTRGAMIPVETVKVSTGRVDALVPQGPQRGVLLESTGKIQAITKQGRLAVIAREGAVTVAALEGDALVGKAGRFKPLLAGTIRIFNLRTGVVTNEKILKAPTAQAGGLGVALGGSAEVKVVATKITGATTYRTQLIHEDGTQVGGWIESANPEELIAKAPHAGSYWVVVRGIDRFGIAGEPSEPLPVQVLGLKNDAEVVRHGMIFLAPGQQANIVGQRGLIMRYGTSPEFIPAPQSISLPGKKATTVEFRDPGDPNRFAVFKLAPRLLNTRIDLGPGDCFWPRDPVEMRVRMWDGHGHPLSWMDEYRIVVKVGVDEVPVEWKPGNGELTATLEPQTGAGPWVVRVSVLDPTGSEIGRNFLEVIRPPKPKPKQNLLKQ